MSLSPQAVYMKILFPIVDMILATKKLTLPRKPNDSSLTR